MRIKVWSICIIFLAGLLSGSYLFSNSSDVELPLLNFFSANSTPAPLNYIEEDRIKIYDDRVVIMVDGASLSSYAPTGSMRPVLDEWSNGIRIKPISESEINEGDIITFRQDKLLIVHRVVEKGIDRQGIYFITKGDNNSVVDGKVRFEDIEWKTIGVIY